MSLLRAFVACELSGPLQDAIQEATADLRERLGPDLVRWVPRRNIHLTLKFLGEVSSSRLDLILRALRAEASRHEVFDMLVAGTGAFPNARRPRVLWVGLKAPPTLDLLQRDLDSATARLGYKSEEREFSPHLTIGYVRSGTSAAGQERIREALVRTQVGNLGSQHVDAVHLFKSDLQRTGAVHTKMLTAPLGKD